jgi:hypothetical protein
MKKILFTILAIALFVPTFAQSDLTITICGNTEKVIPLAKITECGELFVNNENWKVESFKISIAIGDKVIEMNNKGNKLSEKMINVIKESNPDKVFIENIQLVSQDSQTATIKALVLTIKK